MKKTGLEIKVGLFVAICLILLAALLLQFSKGTTFFRPTYSITLKAGNVGALKPRSSVLMAGVQIGTVSGIELEQSGKSVLIYLKIYEQFKVHKDARFTIESAGFLGDQYVAIYPESNTTPLFEPGEIATVPDPFNLQEVARKAAGFIDRLDQTAAKLNDAINDVRRLVLNEQTLTNLSFTVATLRQVSVDAVGTVSNVNLLITSNAVPASAMVSNLMAFSDHLNVLARSAQNIVDTNGPQISAAINNAQNATASLTNLLGEAQAGHGLAGTFLKDDQTAANLSVLMSNLAVTSSNLNSEGLWRVIWGPKHRDKQAPADRDGKSAH